MRNDSGSEHAEPARHTIGEIVATGSLGMIYRAREAVTGRDVAMKRMHRELVTEPGAADRFMHEARLTALLEHPNVVPVHDAEEDPHGTPYYTMKLVRGSSLAEVLAALAEGDAGAAKAHPLPSLLTVLQKVCDAVAFAHSKGAAHRDLKPASIMMGDYGEVLLMGWGKTAPPAATDPGCDQLRDIQALGAILYEVLALRPPFPSLTPEEDAAGGAPPPPSPLPVTGRRAHLPGGNVPASLAAVALKALASQPARRYPRVQALQADIRAYQSGFATAAESAGPWRQFRLFAARHRNVSIALAGSAALIAFIAALYGAEILRANRAAHAERIEAFAALALSEKETLRARQALGQLSHLGPEFSSNAHEFIKAGRFPEALEHLGYAVDVEAENAGFHLAHAHLQQASGHLADAIAAYQRVLQLRPDPSAKLNLELSQDLLRESDGARPLPPAQRKRLAEAVIAQGRSADSPPDLFRTDE